MSCVSTITTRHSNDSDVEIPNTYRHFNPLTPPPLHLYTQRRFLCMATRQRHDSNTVAICCCHGRSFRVEGGKRKKEKGRREGEETGEGKETEGKGFAGPMSKYFLHVYAPVSDCMGSPVTCSYVYVPVGTVIFKTNNRKAK